MSNIKGKDNYVIMPQIGGVDIVPSGGTTGQVLTKLSGTSHNYSWQNTTSNAQPTNQIVYGTGTGSASSSEFTYNAATKTLVLGAASSLKYTAITGTEGSLEVKAANFVVANFKAATTYRVFELLPTATAAPIFKMYEASNNGTNFIALTVPANLTADQNITLPATIGTTGQVLSVQSVAGTTVNTQWKTATAGNGLVDRQMVSSATVVSTTSTSYIDLSGMSITTKNLGGNGTYVIHFTANGTNVGNSQQVYYRLMIGGVAQTNSVSRITAVTKNGAADEYRTPSISWIASNVPNGTIIKVQWQVSVQTGYTGERRLSVDGVITSAVVV